MYAAAPESEFAITQSGCAIRVGRTLGGLIYHIVFGWTWRVALVLFVLVVSHWELDVAVVAQKRRWHPGVSPRLVLGLRNSIFRDPAESSCCTPQASGRLTTINPRRTADRTDVQFVHGPGFR